MAKILMVLFVVCGLQTGVFAQENSPYSRFGLGDLTPNRNILTRGMAGIAAGIADNASINFTNPASLTAIGNTIFDVGLGIDYRILKSTVPAKKFTSANTYISYLQLAFPLTTPKMAKKNMFWAMSLGLKPVTKINYKIEKNERLTGIDSLNTLYEGKGGVNQAFVGTALKYKNLSFGVNLGYMFGSEDYSARLSFINDTTYYYKSNSETTITFGGFFLNAGMQYDITLKKDEKDNIVQNLRVGVYGNMKQNLKANRDLIRETIIYDPNGNVLRVDSVYNERDTKGRITYPTMIGIGGIYQSAHWIVGLDFEYGNWSAYRVYGQADQVQNNWTVRAGTQYSPYKLGTPTSKYFKFVKYRFGVFYGPDYINTNANRPEYGITIGAGMPLTSLKQRNIYGDYVVLNTALEIGNRGNKQTNLRENLVRFSVGVSMNALWFRKQKYQ